MMNDLDIKDTVLHEYCYANLPKIPKDLCERNILFR